jgi:hypothetical protein
MVEIPQRPGLGIHAREFPEQYRKALSRYGQHSQRRSDPIHERAKPGATAAVGTCVRLFGMSRGALREH